MLSVVSENLRWVPETFHALFPVSVKSYKWPAAFFAASPLVSSACGRHLAKAPRRTREKTSGTQGSENHKKPYFICFHYQFRAKETSSPYFLFARRAKRARHANDNARI